MFAGSPVHVVYINFAVIVAEAEVTGFLQSDFLRIYSCFMRFLTVAGHRLPFTEERQNTWMCRVKVA